MKYKEEIEKSFEFLGFSPRGNQIEDINTVIEAFLDEGFKTVILSASAGAGKSIIAAVVAETIHRIKKPNSSAGASFLLSPTNLLSDQYFNTFMKDRDPWDDRFKVIKGAANFECTAQSRPEEYQSAESCTIRVFRKNNLNSVIEEHCNRCAYQKQKMFKDKARHLITNYALYMVDRLHIQLLERRTMCVFDEGHLINDIFTEFNAIEFSDDKLDKMLDEVEQHLTLPPASVVIPVQKVITKLRDFDGVNESNYFEVIESLAEVYSDIAECASRIAESTQDAKKYITLSRMSNRYSNLAMRIVDLIEHKYPHAFDFKQANPQLKQKHNEVSIKPIFLGEMFSSIENADYNLIMSATISEKYARTTIELPNAKYIRLKPAIPKDHKKIIFYKPINLSYTTLQNQEVVDNLCNSCVDVIKKHLALKERGIVLTPSFVLNQKIATAVKRALPNAIILEHYQGEKLQHVLEEFKNFKGPIVMITPSGYEGMDLTGDLSRFQVIVKAPFASLGEARIKHISINYPEIYSILSLMKLVQGAGRSVRGPDDWAVTYMLDSNIQRLWTSKNMAWGDEFETIYTKFLT